MDILTLALAKSKSGSANGTITTESITNALGYKPADQEDVSQLSSDVDTQATELKGDLSELAQKSINLFNYNNVIDDKYINNSNIVSDNTNWRYLPDYIEAKQGDTVYVTNGYTVFINWYDENKNPTTNNMVGNVTLNETNGYSVNITSANVRYFRVSLRKEYDLDTFCVALNTDEYFQYGKYLVSDDNERINYADIEKTVKKTLSTLVVDSGNILDLYDTFKKAYELRNCDVYVQGGIYTFTDSFCDSLIDSGEKGIIIGHNCRYFFDSKSKIVCNYRGTKQAISNLFVFNSTYNGDGSFEFYNLDIEASNVCYAIHDEYNGNNKPYRNVYHHCHIFVDNTGYSSGAFATNKCIGGGLGANSEIVIDGCYFEATTDDLEDVSYHGNTNDTSHLLVKNSYFKHTLALNTPVSQTDEKTLIFCGNSLGQELYYQSEEARSAWNVFAWNNEIRNS